MSQIMQPHDAVAEHLRTLAVAAAPCAELRLHYADEVLALARRRRWIWRAAIGTGSCVVVAAGFAAALPSGGDYFAMYQPSGSMSPTVEAGEQVVFGKNLPVARGDVVAVSGLPGIDMSIIRRVIGMPGDIVSCPADESGKCDAVEVNGRAMSESYVVPDREPFAEVTVPAGDVYLLGDARRAAIDSRDFGPVSLNSVYGVGVEVIDVHGESRPIPGTPEHAPPTGQIDPADDPPPAGSVTGPAMPGQADD